MGFSVRGWKLSGNLKLGKKIDQKTGLLPSRKAAYPTVMKPALAIAFRSSIFLLGMMGIIACSQEAPADPSTGTEVETDAELVRLIATHGSAVEMTLEHLPEIEEKLASGTPSPLRAAGEMLAKTSSEKKEAFLNRLESTLSARKFLLDECSGLPNGVYQAAAEDPELKAIADQALAKSGMEPEGMTTYEVMSEMTSGQDAAMLTALARTIGEKNEETKEKLKAKFRGLVAKEKAKSGS